MRCLSNCSLLTVQGYSLLAGMQSGGIYFSYLVTFARNAQQPAERWPGIADVKPVLQMPVALRASLSDKAWEPGVFSLGR